MNRVFSYGLSILSGCILAACSTSPEVPYSLMCEYLSEPLGIDMSSPRLSWKIRGGDRFDRVLSGMGLCR